MATVTNRHLARSSSYGVAVQIWRIGSRFFLTPLIIASIGLEGFGAWTLLFTICAYVTIIDSAFGVAYSKFTAEYDAKRDYRSLAEVLGAGIVVVGSVATLALTVIWVARAHILKMLGVPDALLPQAGQALLLVSISVLMQMSVGCVFQILAGLQRMDLQYKTRILWSVVEFVVSIVLLYRGWGLPGLAVGYLSGQIIATAVAWLLCRRLCPELRISPFRAKSAAFRRILSLGGRFQILGFLRLFMLWGTKFVISGLLGVSTLGIYEIAYKLLSLANIAGGAVIAPLMPAFANLHTRGQGDRFRLLYERGSKVVILVSFPCFGFLAIFADRLIMLWTSQDYPLAAWTVRCMVSAFFVVLLTGVGTASLRGRGTVRLEMGYAVIAVILLGAFMVPGYWLWGYKGIILAIAASWIVASAWFLVTFARREGFSLTHYLRETLLRPVSMLGPVVVIIAVLQSMLHVQMVGLSDRMNALLEVSVWSGLFSVPVLGAIWYGVLSASERAWVTCRLPWRVRVGSTQVSPSE